MLKNECFLIELNQVLCISLVSSLLLTHKWPDLNHTEIAEISDIQ